MDDLNWLLERGCEVSAKEYLGRMVLRLVRTVVEWVQDQVWSERLFGWVTEPATSSVRPVRRIVVRCRRQDGTFAYGVLICSLSALQVLTVLGRTSSQVADPVAVLAAYVMFYDLRGGGIKTSFKGDKQGLGLAKRNKKHFEAQQMVVWARRWLMNPQIQHSGLLRMVCDVFHVRSLLRFDTLTHVVEIVLNQDAHLAHSLLGPLQELLTPLHIVVNLGET